MASQVTESTITSSLVADSDRPNFLPKYFGNFMLIGETFVYRFADKLAAGYNGGYWHFYSLSNGGFYMAPAYDEPMAITVDGNYFDDSMSPDAAGIVITLFALNTLVNQYHEAYDVDDLCDRYHFLRDYACTHPEASLILRAID